MVSLEAPADLTYSEHIFSAGISAADLYANSKKQKKKKVVDTKASKGRKLRYVLLHSYIHACHALRY